MCLSNNLPGDSHATLLVRDHPLVSKDCAGVCVGRGAGGGSRDRRSPVTCLRGGAYSDGGGSVVTTWLQETPGRKRRRVPDLYIQLCRMEPPRTHFGHANYDCTNGCSVVSTGLAMKDGEVVRGGVGRARRMC